MLQSAWYMVLFSLETLGSQFGIPMILISHFLYFPKVGTVKGVTSASRVTLVVKIFFLKKRANLQ